MVAAGVLSTAVLISPLMNCGSKINNPVNPVDITPVDTSKVRKDSVIYTGELGVPLPCNVKSGPACILDKQWKVFGELPIQFLASGPSLVLPTQRGTLFKKVAAVSGETTRIDLGFDSVAVDVDTVVVDSANRYVKVSVTKLCDSLGEPCGPTIWLDCGDDGKMTSSCIPLGIVYHFGEYTLRLDGVDLSTPTKLKAMVSVLRYDCSVAAKVTIPELVTDTLVIGTQRLSVRTDSVHFVVLPDSTGALAKLAALPKVITAANAHANRVEICATLTVRKECGR